MQQAIEEIAKRAKEAFYKLCKALTWQKDKALELMAKKLSENKDFILEENKKDIQYAKELNLSPALLDRLVLNEKRIHQMINCILQVRELKDPIGEVINMTRRPNGLLVGKMRVPIGVICVIYESRPNVTADCASLCIKSSNAIILRGGKEAINSNRAISLLLKGALKEADLPQDAISFIDNPQREVVKLLAGLDKYIDLMILRGGKELMEQVGKSAAVAVIFHGEGNCCIYVDDSADFDMAERIVINAKCQRPSVCNAVEKLLVSKKIANIFLPKIIKKLQEKNVLVKGCEFTCKIAKENNLEIEKAQEEDWYKEYLDLIIAIKVVDDLDSAICWINKYGSGHSDAIITNNYSSALRFINEVDSAAVYVNASTRFTDGYEFGLGSEMGISTQKLHARGPMGLRELTTTKFIIYGDGQIREG